MIKMKPNNENNLISILITNYNKEKFLKKNLTKICNEKFKNHEILLYDDCSDDDSIKIIKKYKKIRLIRNLKKKKNSGPLNQLSGIIKLFKMSKGNIICLLDADDHFFKDKLTKINNFFIKNKNMNCIFNMPKGNNKNFKFKNKEKRKTIWPTIFPTSCISIRKSFFKNFIKHSEKNKFDRLEIDARITIFSNFYFNEYNVVHEKLTKYNYDPNGITADIKKFSALWWKRRYQAYLYLRILLKKKRKIFTPSLDFYVTFFINIFNRK